MAGKKTAAGEGERKNLTRTKTQPMWTWTTAANLLPIPRRAPNGARLTCCVAGR